MARQKTTPQPTTEPPRALSVRVNTDDMRDDLAVIMRAHGGTYGDPVRLAIRHLADAYRRAWDYQEVPDGTPPHIIGIRYALPDGTPEPAPDPAHTHHPNARDTDQPQ